MAMYKNDDEALTHEVPLGTLRAGARFESYTSTRVRAGVLLHRGLGGCDVFWEDRTSREIVTGEGAVRTIVTAGVASRCASTAGVVPTGEIATAEDLKKFTRNTNQKREDNTMTKKEKKTKEPKEPKPRALYQSTAKLSDTEKGKALLDDKNKTQRAIVAQEVDGAKAPIAFADLVDRVAKSVTKLSRAKLEANVRWYLGDLRKAGFVKSDN